jgi:hypothetical protein
VPRLSPTLRVRCSPTASEPVVGRSPSAPALRGGCSRRGNVRCLVYPRERDHQLLGSAVDDVADRRLPDGPVGDDWLALYGPQVNLPKTSTELEALPEDHRESIARTLNARHRLRWRRLRRQHFVRRYSAVHRPSSRTVLRRSRPRERRAAVVRRSSRAGPARPKPDPDLADHGRRAAA